MANTEKKIGDSGVIAAAIVTGGAAGNITVTGIAVGDVLAVVLRLVGAVVTITNMTNLTGEFSVTAADTINNAGGTSTAGDKLLVLYVDKT